MRVVAAAMFREGRVLAAHRMQGWEFPGGKVEPGESDAAALERELQEELCVQTRAIEELATVRDERVELVLWRVATLGDHPRAGVDHDELRWVGADELTGLDWLVLDQQLLALVTELLRT